MKVCIDDLITVECDGLINGGETWNGWQKPIFNADQLDIIREFFFNGTPNDPELIELWSSEVIELGNGQYTFDGWTWDMARSE